LPQVVVNDNDLVGHLDASPCRAHDSCCQMGG
jgi:hypothetical protein